MTDLCLYWQSFISISYIHQVFTKPLCPQSSALRPHTHTHTLNSYIVSHIHDNRCFRFIHRAITTRLLESTSLIHSPKSFEKKRVAIHLYAFVLDMCVGDYDVCVFFKCSQLPHVDSALSSCKVHYTNFLWE